MKIITDHVVNLPINLSIEWEVDDAHCDECDPYEVSKPVSASYAVGGGEASYYYFGMAEDNLIEEAITKIIQHADITYEG